MLVRASRWSLAHCVRPSVDVDDVIDRLGRLRHVDYIWFGRAMIIISHSLPNWCPKKGLNEHLSSLAVHRDETACQRPSTNAGWCCFWFLPSKSTDCSGVIVRRYRRDPPVGIETENWIMNWVMFRIFFNLCRPMLTTFFRRLHFLESLRLASKLGSNRKNRTFICPPPSFETSWMHHVIPKWDQRFHRKALL